MNMILAGALSGTAVALLLVATEYSMLRDGATERAKRKGGRSALDRAERKQVASIVGFCIFIPPAFAAFFWLLWG